MGDHQLFVANRGKPRILNEKLLMFCGAPALPCATRLGVQVGCELNAAMRSRSMSDSGLVVGGVPRLCRASRSSLTRRRERTDRRPRGFAVLPVEFDLSAGDVR